MTFPQHFETDQAETERLAAADAGSKNHELSLVPVTFREVPTGHLLSLPGNEHTIVITVLEQRNRRTKGDDGRVRHDASHVARIVASDHPRYPAGGYDIVVTDAEIRRSQPIDLLTLLSS